MSAALYLSDPIARHREVREYMPGQTLAEIAPGWQMPYVAIVGDAPVLRADWDTTVLVGDVPVIFVALPQDPVTAIVAAFVADAAATYLATELVMAAAVGWTSAAAVTALYTAGYLAAYVAVSYVVSAAIGTPSSPSNQSLADAAAASPTYSLTAASNQARVNQPIPVQYGRMKVFPDLLTAPYAEYRTDLDSNGDQYLIQHLMLGQGDYDVESVLIDDTPITQFGDVSYGVLAPGQAAPSGTPVPPIDANVMSFSGNIDHDLFIEVECVDAVVRSFSATGTSGTIEAAAAGAMVFYDEYSEGWHGDLSASVSCTTLAESALLGRTITASIAGFSGRGSANVVQQPTAANQWRAKIECFDHDGGEGSYSFNLRITAPSINFPSLLMYTTPEVGSNTLETNAPQAYIAVPEGRTTTRVYLDFLCPKGLYYSNTDGSLSEMRVFVRIEYRAVSTETWQPLTGTAYGPWSGWSDIQCGGSKPSNTSTEEYQWGSCCSGDEYGCNAYYLQRRTRAAYDSSITISAATTTPQRRTVSFNLPAGRYEIRATRLDTKDTSARAGHEVQWIGLRAELNAPAGFDTAFGNTTRLWITMRASDQLTQQSARKLAVIATRKLPIWNGSAWSAPTATRSIAWAIADCLRATYGAQLADSRIDLAGLLALDAEWAARDDRFDAVFDGRVTVWEALGKIARAGRARPYMQGGRIRIARDRQESTPVAMFTPANILAGSFSMQYLMPGEQTAEEIRVRYFSETTWKQAETIYTHASADPDKFAEVDLFGVTSATQAQREAQYLAQTNRYRRRMASFDVELEGMILSPLDLILISHDLPDWGQHAIARQYDSATRTLTCDRDLTWGTGTHYARARARDGACSAAIAVTQGATAATLVFASDPGTIDLAGREPTHIAFGAGTAWQVMAKVLTMRPKDEYTATITALIENDLVHSGC